MKSVFIKRFILISFICFISSTAILNAADNVIHVFTWDGYVIEKEVKAVNELLKEKGYDYTVEVISPFAEGPEQMYTVLRSGKADISFLTLNYIKMQGGKTAKLLQQINVNSPRLTNYKHLSKSLTDLQIGMKGRQHLYVPWGGGAYGIWANMDKLKEDELPKSVKDLWAPKWKGKLSLAEGQVQPNIALTMLSLGKPPFHLNDIAGKHSQLLKEGSPTGIIQQKTTELYGQVGSFWGNGPDFSDDSLQLVASYGIAASKANSEGGNWKLVKFDEGNTVWLDTINFHKGLKGKKLEAAEIFLNYFIGPEVQERVVKGLGMVAASTLIKDNKLLKENPNFFEEKMFWPPYDKRADNVILSISNRAMEARKK